MRSNLVHGLGDCFAPAGLAMTVRKGIFFLRYILSITFARCGYTRRGCMLCAAKQKEDTMTGLESLQFDQSATYQIRVQGRLDGRWAQWFDGMSIAFEKAGDGSTVTVLTGSVIDQAALYGLINRMRDLGLPLISVGRI
jgi:hypothetical protein